MRRDIKTALITGAGSGIGRALAMEAARRSIKLILVGRRIGPLEETAGLIGGMVSVEPIAADIATPAGRDSIIGTTRELFGHLDYLVNNAGSVCVDRFEDTSDEAFERLCAVNLLAPAALSRLALPLLKSAEEGRIVNVGSMFGDIAFPRFAAYSATKFALRGLSDGLRRELASDGIGVTYAAPRATRTPAACQFDALVKPMGMVLDTPEKVARDIWRAAIKGRARLYPGMGERIFSIVQSVLPSLPDSHIANLERKLRLSGI